MGLEAAFEIGKTGLNIYQTATDITGENIANVNTPGYSRQQVVLETSSPILVNGLPLGTGVTIASIDRSYDSLLQQQLVNAQTTLGYDTTRSNVLQQVEPTFNEVANDGLGAAISNFFGAWQDLTLNPAGQAERQAVLTDAQVLTDNFHSVATTLNSAVTTQNNALSPLTQSINATLANIAQLNGQIQTTELVSGNANELRDQRDQLIQNLAKQIDITYTENGDGTTDVNFTDAGGTYSLVSGSSAGAFSLTTDATTGLYDVNLTPAGGGTPTQVSPTGGVLGAILDVRDTVIPGYLSQVDVLATTIATAVNTQHEAGCDLSGNSGIAFFDPATTSAASIAVNPALTSTSQIAAAASGAPSGDNSNALLIANLQNALTMSSNSSTFNGYYDSLVSTVGLDVQSAKNTVSQDNAFSLQLTNLRESNSGVSLDEELTNLVKYQRSYQASAKLITTATEMLDTVLGMIQ